MSLLVFPFRPFPQEKVGVCEINLDVQHFCDKFVIGELGSVVGSDGKYVEFFRY